MSTSFLVTALILVVVAVAALAVVAVRKLVNGARVEGQGIAQAELVRITAQLENSQQQKQETREKLSVAERQLTDLRGEFQAIRDERAQLAERATKIPELEARITELLHEATRRDDQIKTLSSELAEKKEALIQIQRRNEELAADAEAQKTRADGLQGKLQAETNRTASLSEQAARVPALEKELVTERESVQRLTQENAELREQSGRTTTENEALRKRATELQRMLDETTGKLEQTSDDLSTARSERAQLTTQLQSEREQMGEKLTLLQNAREELSNQFKALASEILDEKSKKFTEQNQANLGQLLEPLQTRIKEFKDKVEQVYFDESNARTALQTQVQQLMTLNKQLSEDAHNLTHALKGSSKTQGNWGEVILEHILEASGLRKGEEYELRQTLSREDGGRAQPDVIIHLPEGRHLIVDAKVSLVAYNDYVAAVDDEERRAALDRHLQSVRAHLKDLSGKNYQLLHQLNSLDFVIMFLPIEPAFMLAIAHDASLWDDAYQKNVLLVSPSTLLFVVRTVAHLWRTERQNQSVAEIVKRGAALYDKLRGFVEALREVGTHLDHAKNSYSDAYTKLTTGNGNVIRQAQMLTELGVKPKKLLPTEVVEFSSEDQLTLPEKAAAATNSQ